MHVETGLAQDREKVVLRAPDGPHPPASTAHKGFCQTIALRRPTPPNACDADGGRNLNYTASARAGKRT
jgi:hypothetical protein